MLASHGGRRLGVVFLVGVLALLHACGSKRPAGNAPSAPAGAGDRALRAGERSSRQEERGPAGPSQTPGARASKRVRLAAHVTWDKRLLKNSRPDLGFSIVPEGAKGRTVEGPIPLVEKEQWVTGPSENGVKLDLVFSCAPGRYDVFAGVFGLERLQTGKAVITCSPDGGVEPQAIRLVLKRM